MKVGFYLSEIKDEIDYSIPMSSNPGLGGTQFLICSISYYLSQLSQVIDVYIFSKQPERLPSVMNSLYAENEEDYIYKCKKFDINYAVLRGPIVSEKTVISINQCQQKVVVWSHNFEDYVSVKRMEKCKYIVRNICVSREQYQILLDTELYKKSTFIYNGMCFEDYIRVSKSSVVDERKICYIGNLYPGSGYEAIIDAWPTIEKNCKGANLYIIGGNNLYYKSKLSGFYSKKSFDRLNKKIKRNFYENGKLKENIHFLGVIGGDEKLRQMANASIGIANLTYAGETFGLSAVEFEALSVPVISVNFRGIRDTVLNKCGLLPNNHKMLAESVIKLYNDPILRKSYAGECKKYVFDKFSIEKIVKDWEKMFLSIDDPISFPEVSKYEYSYDRKKIIYTTYLIKKVIKCWPSSLIGGLLKYYFFRVFQKLNII